MKGLQRVFAIVSVLSVGFLGASSPAGATTTSTANTTLKVAYVYDPGLHYAQSQGCDPGRGHGVNDESNPNSDQGCPGESIFSNAITGNPLGTGESGTYESVSFTNVPVATLDANPALLTSYDTVMLYQLCTFGATANAPARSAINAFLAAGGKLMIFDADACGSPSHGGLGQVDYSGFLFPFSTNSPGPAGARGSYTKIEASTLTTGLQLGLQAGDAVGDANTFTSNAGGWCGSITASNVNGNNGFVEAYARTATGGLAIFEGEDFWYTDGFNSHLQKVFDLVLKQGWNPDGLPCGTPTSGIKLEPASDTKTVGQTETLTATVTDSAGAAKAGVDVTFTVSSGPDLGKTGHSTTDATGKATFSFTNTTNAGLDKAKASFVDATQGVHSSNESDITWVAATPLITLAPASDSKPVHQSETLTATVKNAAGSPQSNVVVTFHFSSGPDSPRPDVTATTDSNGKAVITFTNGGIPGSDKVVASFATEGGAQTSNEAAIMFTPIVLPATGGGASPAIWPLSLLMLLTLLLVASRGRKKTP